MQQPVELADTTGILFTLKDVTCTPKQPKMKEAITIEGQVDLFGFRFFFPIFVVASITYPKKFWEVIGSPVVHQMSMVVGGHFSIKFAEGFDREGDYTLDVDVFAGPTVITGVTALMKSVTVPPIPAVAHEEMTFTVAGALAGQSEVTFDLLEPTATPTKVNLGDTVSITCPVRNNSSTDQTVSIVAEIHESPSALQVITATTVGALVPGGTFRADNVLIAAGKTYNFSFTHTATGKTDGEWGRDIAVSLYIGTGLTPNTGPNNPNNFRNKFYVVAVGAGKIDFTIPKPTVSPATALPGQQVTLTCSITSKCETRQTVTMYFDIYDPDTGMGTLLQHIEVPAFDIDPNQTVPKSVTYTITQTNHSTRNVGVGVQINGVDAVTPYTGHDVIQTQAVIGAGDFAYTQPTINGKVQPHVNPSDSLSIVCPIISKFSVPVTVAKGRVDIYQGSWWVTPGDLVQSFAIPQFTIAPNETVNLGPLQTIADGALCPKDIQVFLYIDNTEYHSQNFANAYYVETAYIGFSLIQPSASPNIANVGDTVVITCPVVSNCGKPQAITVLVEIKQAGFLWMAGPTIDSKSFTTTINPGATYNAVVNHIATTGGPTDSQGVAMRHVAVTVSIGGQPAPNTGPNNPNEFDNVFGVQTGGAAGQYTLTTEVSPSGSGYVTPNSGTYAAGTQVTITAYSYSGWDFNYWGGDASGILSSTTITMDGDKHAVAYFRYKLPL